MNNTSLIEKGELKKIFEESINQLEKNYSKLRDLAHLLHDIANISQNKYCIFYTISRSLGEISYQISKFEQLVSIPLLETQKREEYQQALKDAYQEIKQFLTHIKEEICRTSYDDIDYKKLLDAISNLFRIDYQLYTLAKAVEGQYPLPTKED